MKKIFLSIAISFMTSAMFAQTEYMIVAQKDGSTVKVKVSDVDSISFMTLYGESLVYYNEDGVNVDMYDLEINPVTKLPNLLVVGDDKPASMIEFNGTSWVNVGTKGFTTTAPYSSASLAFDKNGVPYTYFVNSEKNSEVFKFANGAWASLGGSFGTSATVTETFDGIALDAVNDPIVSFMSSKAIGAVARRTLMVSYFDGSSWLADQTIAGVAATNYNVKIFNAAGNVYVGFLQQGAGLPYRLYKYNGEFSWEKVCEILPEGATGGNIVGGSWVVSNDGKEIFLLAGVDNITASVYYPTVFRYRVDTGKWSQISDPIPSAGGENGQTIQSAARFEMALDSNGNPIVFYKDYDNNKYPTILTLNNETKQWNDPVVLENTSLLSTRLTIKSIEPGVQYAAYIKEVNGVQSIQVVTLNY